MNIKKNAHVIRRIIIILSIIIATIFYLRSFSINESNIEIKLSEYLNDKSLEILDVHEIGDIEVKDLIVYFETKNSSGISLLHKGLNKKYQINDIHQTNEEISCVSFLIDRKDYSIIYGKSDTLISKLKLKTEYIKDIDSKYIFIMQNNRGYEGEIEIVYEKSSNKEPNKIEVQTIQGSSWKTITVPLGSVTIVILSFIFTSLFSNKYNNVTLDEYSELPKDGQRIKQFRPW